MLDVEEGDTAAAGAGALVEELGEMKTNGRLVKTVVVMGLSAAGLRAGETLESLELQVTQRWKTVETLTATTRMESERKTLDRTVKKTTTGTYVFLRDGDKEMVRQELETYQDLEMTMGKDTPTQSIATSEKKIMVSDGEKIKMLSESTRGTKAAKTLQAGSGLVIGGRSLFQTMFKGAELQILPDSRFEGREAWVVQAVMDKGYTKTSYLIDKEWGVLLQRVTYQGKDMEDIPATTYTISQLKVNARDVTPEQFKFEFPPGMEVKDETKLGE